MLKKMIIILLGIAMVSICGCSSTQRANYYDTVIEIPGIPDIRVAEV